MVSNRGPFFDSRQIPAGTEIDCDVCIIGAGVAGITIAQELINEQLKVIVLESGGEDYDETTEDLGRLVVSGRPYPPEGSRLRFLGGTSNHWGGHCVPLRSHVFEKRAWMDNASWPFSINELHPFYARAHQILGIGPYSYDPAAIAQKLNMPILPFRPTQIETVLSRYHRMNFRDRYRTLLDKAKNIDVFLYATVSSLRVSDDRRRVTEVLAKSLTDKHFTVKAKTTVLSAGGIENARILLLSNEQISRGIGNQNDLVGRHFADHVWYNSGYILPFDQHPSAAALYQDEHHFDGNYGVRCHLALPANLNQELQIPEYRVELQVKRTYSFHKSVFSALRVREKLLSLNVDEISADDILNILQNPHEPIRFLWDKHDGPLVYGFGNYVETVPNPESRVMLSSERDALGLSRPELRWALTNQDKEGIIKAQKSFAREVGRSGVGRMRIFIPEVEDGILEGATGGNHHMGTTRMHNNAKFGVVDADSRVHGLQNLYVAGSSVFPSYGYANPTLTIVALSVRLADHLRMTCGCD